MFLDLRQELGEEQFREGARRLYRAPGPTGIAQVTEAFRVSQAVARWYGGPSPRSGRQPEDAEPNRQMEEIGGTIDDAGIILGQDGPLVDSLSAAGDGGQVYFRFGFEHPPFAGESRTVNLVLAQSHEDGLIYDSRLLRLDMQGPHTGRSWSIPVGPPEGIEWKTGLHRAALHEGSGDKVAEAVWEVAP